MCFAHHSPHSLAWLCEVLESRPVHWILIETEDELEQAFRRCWPELREIALSAMEANK
jgi:hypothetical protein